ncbi:MAG: hypothetical protein V9E94_01745 [Microthrixaceae bacterium]
MYLIEMPVCSVKFARVVPGPSTEPSSAVSMYSGQLLEVHAVGALPAASFAAVVTSAGSEDLTG